MRIGPPVCLGPCCGTPGSPGAGSGSASSALSKSSPPSPSGRWSTARDRRPATRRGRALLPLDGQLTVLLPQPENPLPHAEPGGCPMPRTDRILLGDASERGEWPFEPNGRPKRESSPDTPPASAAWPPRARVPGRGDQPVGIRLPEFAFPDSRRRVSRREFPADLASCGRPTSYAEPPASWVAVRCLPALRVASGSVLPVVSATFPVNGSRRTDCIRLIGRPA